MCGCETSRAFLYIVAQSVGAIIAALVLKSLRNANGGKDSLCTSQPSDGVSLGQVFGYELIISFVLVFTVFATCDSNRSGIGGSGPLAIGLSIAMCHLWAVSMSYMLYSTAVSVRVYCYSDATPCGFRGLE